MGSGCSHNPKVKWGHMYKNDTGYPSSTEIISPYIDKTWFKEQDSKKGEIIHQSVQNFLEGKFFIKSAYVLSFMKWFDVGVKDVDMVETRLVDKQRGYTGQIDAVFTMKTGKKLLVDFKTSTNFYKHWFLQIESYRRLYLIGKDDIEIQAATLRLKKDGGLPLANIDENPNLHWDKFLKLLDLWRFFNG